MFTNAALIDRSHVALFKKYPPRDIEITVYGGNERDVRAGHPQARQLRKIHARSGFAFWKAACGFASRAVPIPVQHRRIRRNRRILPGAGPKDYYRFDPQLHLRFDGDERRNREIVSERLTPEEIVALEQADEKRMAVFMKSCDALINHDLAHVNCNHLFHCGAGNGSFNVSYDGYVPALRLPVAAGNPLRPPEGGPVRRLEPFRAPGARHADPTGPNS